MSTELLDDGHMLRNKILVTSFFGGPEKGSCVQLTPIHEGYAALTRYEVLELIYVLTKWANEHPN